MRYLAWFFGLITTLAAALYIVAFTSFGNGLVKPVVEQKIKEATKLESKLTKFSLSMSKFEILLELNSGNTLLAVGNYSLFSKAFDIAYRVKLDELDTLKDLTSSELRGKFHTEGKIKGDMAFMDIDGKSDIAQSDTTYHVELTDLNPTSIIAKVKNSQLSKLLYMLDQSQYASAEVDLDVNFKNIKPGELDGDITLRSKNGQIDPLLMKKDFNVTIPKTSFALDLNAKLKGEDIDYSCDLSSNLFKILSSGRVVPQPLKTDIKYSLNIKELAVLKPIIGSQLRGAFKLSGNVKGNKERLIISGQSDLAGSDTKFEAALKEFKPKVVTADIKGLNLNRLLYMIDQPHYTDGILSMKADITDARSGSLKGKIFTNVKKGVLNSKYITKLAEFDSVMPRTTYDLSATTVLNGDIVDTKTNLNSNLAELNIKKASYNIGDGSIKSDYSAKIPDLDRLFFATQRHLKGSLAVSGELKKAKDLDLTMHTKVAGGDIDAKLHNDNMHAEIKSVGTKGLLQILTYPDIFQAQVNAKLDYDLAKGKGVLNGHVTDGNFVQNKTFNLIKQYTKFDMYRESFNGDISANINKEKILASLDLRSKQASIKSDKAKIDAKRKTIDADIIVQAKKNTIPASIRGDINSPKVQVDLKKLMESETGKAIKKGINKLLNNLFK